MIKPKIKIVHICTFAAGGAGTAAFRIHKALLKGGIDSHFISTDTIPGKDIITTITKTEKKGKVNDWAKLVTKAKWRLKHHLHIDLNKRSEIITNQFYATLLNLDCEIATLPFADFNILESPLIKEANIIHLHWVAGMFDYPSFFEINNSKPVVWTIHDMNPFLGLFHYAADEERNKQVVKKLDSTIKKIKKRAISKHQSPMSIVAPSSWLLNAAISSEIFHNLPGSCIPYALDTNVFTPKREADFWSRNGIPEQNIILLFVAQSVTNYRKGFDLLAAALQKLTDLPLTLLVLGNSGDLSIEGIDIRYPGSIHDEEKLADYYSNADAFIIPSREDNLPNVMLESLACGTPVIGFPVGGIKEHITDFKTGLLAKEISSEALASAINDFCAKKDVFDKEEIRAYAVKHFDEKMIAEKYMEVYHKILAG